MCRIEKHKLSGYRAMWLFAMFDLPVDTKEARRLYSTFRKALIREGFSRLQLSVYARYCPSEESSEVHRRHIERVLPPNGQVRLLAVTDHQFGKMVSFFGKKRRAPESEPQQLLLF